MNDLLPADQLILILGMAIVTYLPRILPLWFLSSRNLNQAMMRWLEMVPPAVLAALLTPALLLGKDAAGAEILFLSPDNAFLVASLPAFAVSLMTRSFFGTVAVGMGCLALLRYLA